MNEVLWSGCSRSKRAIFCFGFENGVLDMWKSGYSRSYDEDMELKNELGKRYFGNELYFRFVNPDHISNLLEGCVGKSEAELRRTLDAFDARRKNRIAKQRNEAESWDQTRERFGGIVLNLDKRVDVYSTGFSVRVILSSQIDFAQRKAFVTANRKELVRWTMDELSGQTRTMKRLGDLRFYRPVEITVLRAPEVEIKFEVKRVLEEAI